MSVQAHIEQLKQRHRQIDELIKEGYSNYIADADLNKMKQAKLQLKDEISRLEQTLEDTA